MIRRGRELSRGMRLATVTVLSLIVLVLLVVLGLYLFWVGVS